MIPYRSLYNTSPSNDDLQLFDLPQLGTDDDYFALFLHFEAEDSLEIAAGSADGGLLQIEEPSQEPQLDEVEEDIHKPYPILNEQLGFDSQLGISNEENPLKSPLLTCPICFDSIHSGLLTQHVQMEHMPDGKPYCTLCERDYHDTNYLIKHHRDQHALVEMREFVCVWQDCGKTFKKRQARDVHYDVVHLGQKEYMCGYCDKEYGNLRPLKKHLDRFHPYDGADPFRKKKPLSKEKVVDGKEDEVLDSDPPASSPASQVD